MKNWIKAISSVTCGLAILVGFLFLLMFYTATLWTIICYGLVLAAFIRLTIDLKIFFDKTEK